ncbi:MAG: inositol monophosphatase family protein [Pseudomonadota bacterium]
MDPLLNLAVKAARRAGALLVRYQDRLDQIKVETKGRNDFVSEVDRMAESDIVDTIHYLYPNHRILAEESGTSLSPTEDADDEIEWIIDPLDGTNNYLHGHGHFCVSIAIKIKGRLEYGVIFDPIRDELFTTSRGHGAQLNNRRIRVSGQGRLSHALIATELPVWKPAELASAVSVLGAIAPRISDIRSSGSAALNLAYVACGRLDAYWQPTLQSWDIAAGALMVREAGGLVSDYAGDQLFLESGNIVSANQKLFTDVLASIRSRLDKDSGSGA